MRCEAAREAMSRYLDEELSPEDRTSLEEHTASCTACRAQLAAHERTWALLARLEPVEAPDVFAAVEARISPRRGLVALVSGLRLRTLGYAAAAALLVAAFVWTGVWAGSTRHRVAAGDHEVADLLSDAPPGMEIVSLLEGIGGQQ